MSAKILIADDDPHIRDVVRFALQQAGMDVCEAKDGAEALSAAASMGPDLIVLDVGMPEMDGRELTTQLKQISPHTPVIMMTGWGKMMRGEEEIRAPVDVLISKPPRMAELQKALRDVFLARPKA